jgi:GMP synthase (glutamine-hydrolysing)
VNEPNAPQPDPAIFELGVPVLGICYGLQLIAKLRGGQVARTELAEYGGRPLTVTRPGRLFAGVPAEIACWMSHGDPWWRCRGFTATAQSPHMPVAAMEDESCGLYGVQFHPEVRHTEYGQDILKNFLYKVCDIAPTWTPMSIIEEAVDRIRAQVGTERVVCGLSGGVDSAVAALLTYKAVGDQLTCIFVDHGLMRKNEGQEVEDTFRRHFHVPLVHVQAQQRFLTKLTGVSDPERKRKIIGEEFIRTFEEESARIGKAGFLVQGTLYSDVIESGTREAAKIKSHHNVGGLPEDIDFDLVDLSHAVQRRSASSEKNCLPEHIVGDTVSGSGLAIRIIAVTEAALILRDADAILLQEIESLASTAGGAAPYSPRARSVGVMGDERTYAYRSSCVRDVRRATRPTGLAAHDLLERISQRIIKGVRGELVVLDISGKPPRPSNGSNDGPCRRHGPPLAGGRFQRQRPVTGPRLTSRLSMAGPPGGPRCGGCQGGGGQGPRHARVGHLHRLSRPLHRAQRTPHQAHRR